VTRRSKVPEASGRLLSGLGLAARAGHLRIGTEAVIRSIRGGEAVAVVIAGDTPVVVRSKLERLLNSRSLPYNVVLDGDALGGAVGRERVVSLAITDMSLGRQVLKLAEEVEG